jgi:serine/threonine protein kinase
MQLGKTEIMADVTIGDYQMQEELGRGAFGNVVKAFHCKTLQEVAIKIENRQMSKSLFLLMEQETLQVLQGPGIPRYIDFFTQGECSYLVTELLGPSIYQRFIKAGKMFTEKTVLMIADQALTRIELMHSKHYIHRDIKPENFITGLIPNENQIYLIDFGLAKKYFNESCGMHIPYKEDKAFASTLEFASRNAHLGVQMSRRDDLESLMYMIIYLFKGSLPWIEGAGLRKDEKSSKIRQQKMTLNQAELTEGLPVEIKEMLKYVLKLEFQETPDYNMLRKLIRHAGHSMEMRFDWVFDWMQTNSRNRRRSEVPMGLIKSVDCTSIKRKKRNSVRNLKGNCLPKGRHGRNHTTFDPSALMMSVDFTQGHSSAGRYLSSRPEQPSACDSDQIDSSEHLTVKDSLGPEFKNRSRILEAAGHTVNASSCLLA